jgi:hypothetical protein
MRVSIIELFILALAAWGNAATLWTADFEDGEINPGAPNLSPLNTTPYPAAQPTPITDNAYGWASKAYNITDARSFSTIVDTTAYSGANSAMVMNRVLRTDIPVTIVDNSIYTFTVHYMVDATTDFNNDNIIQQRVFFRNQTAGLTLADNHPEPNPIYGTVVPYGEWQTVTLTWDSTGSSRVGLTDMFRLAVQFGDAYDNDPAPALYNGGAYVDAMSFTVTPIPEPTTLTLLGFGSLLLLIRRRA